MAKFVSVFISESHRRLIGFLIWMLAFAGVVCFFAWLALHQTAETMRLEARYAADHYVRLHASVMSTLDAMDAQLTADPCTPGFKEQLRKIAYLPDGINEFLYVSDGKARCSVSVDRFDPAIELGSPDLFGAKLSDVALWIDRDLGFLDLDGETGSIVQRGPFALIVPFQDVKLTPPSWMTMQIVVVGQDGNWWHRSGSNGVYRPDHLSQNSLALALTEGLSRRTFCTPNKLHCIATQANLVELLYRNMQMVALALVVAGVFAAWVSNHALSLITRYWSFEARFRRHLDADSIVCAYQPVMDLQSGEITGCEVLARWRDIDDSIVFPDRFIDIVERHDLTLRFTELVAERACEEMTAFLPSGRRLQVNFNIFPRDLDSRALALVFSGFTTQPDRFDVVLEIIESDAIPASAQREIEALRRVGIKTYIDDFGTGYSNMQNLAALSVDGVKLDRAFAMAPDNSLMAQMLRHAVEMIHATGRIMVVEGVETAERLKLLREMQTRIDYVQGYFISRPLTIEAFADFLTPKPVSLSERKREAGLTIVAA